MPRNNPWGYSAGMPSDEFNRKRRARQTAPLGRPSQGLPQFAAPVAEPGAAPGAAAPGAAAPAAGMGMQAAQPIQAPQAPTPAEPRSRGGRRCRKGISPRRREAYRPMLVGTGCLPEGCGREIRHPRRSPDNSPQREAILC